MTLLQAHNLEKRFGGVVAMSQFSLSVLEGDLVGLIGPNGAGKTTAFNVMTGVMGLTGGQIIFDGRNISSAPPEKRARLGMVRTFQNIRLFEDLTVRQNVMAGAHAKEGAPLIHAILGTPKHRTAERKIAAIANEMLEVTGMVHAADEVAGALSYGDKRRVEIARALASRPRLLLLDEPAAGMNETEKVTLTELIRQLNSSGDLSIILVEHNVEMVASLCQRLVVMNKGEILAEGTTGDVLQLPEVKQVYLGRRRDRKEAE